MALISRIAKCFLAGAIAVQALNVQTPLMATEFDLIREYGADKIILRSHTLTTDRLKIAEIIPTVIDEFRPMLTVKIAWNKAKTETGNTIKPKKMKSTPNIYLIDDLPSVSQALKNDDLPQLTLVMTDPDAPSRDNPEWAQFCHWIATDIPLMNQRIGLGLSRDVHEIMPYKPPGPPPKTGKHRYVFVALSPANGTTERLFLSKPKERKRWGYEEERLGLREWANENGLAVVGANFIYSQNKKQ